MQETERIEFKRMVTDDIAKEVIAFANAEGGAIYIGVADNGTPVGLADFDDLLRRVLLRPETAPDARFTHLLVDEFQDINEIQYQLISAWSLSIRLP